MLNIIVKPFIILWTLPQNILGLFATVLFATNRRQKWHYPNMTVFWIHGPLSGFSLGEFIALHKDYQCAPICKQIAVLQHEKGHYIQSLIFGPLYLIVVGIPSILNNLRARYSVKVYNTYYKRYPEKQANQLYEYFYGEKIDL